MTAEEAVRKYIAERSILESVDIQLGSKLTSDLNVDSLDMLDIMIQLEDEFGILISDEDADQLLEGDPTVQELINFVENRLTPAS